MAIQVTTKGKRTMAMVPDAYIRILSAMVTPNEIIMDVGIYADKSARDANARPVEVASYPMPFDPDAQISPFAYAYGELKKLPEFAGAIDV